MATDTATPAATTDWAAVIGALNTAGIVDYQLASGAPVSVTQGPGGASLVQTGAAANQTSGLLIVVGLGVLAFLAWVFFGRK